MVLAGRISQPKTGTDFTSAPAGASMKLFFKMNWSLQRAASEDLRRSHKFAYERVGFFCCHAAETGSGLMLLAESYNPVADEDYVEDNTVGARINGAAFRKALQLSLTRRTGLFHVHLHEHKGMPRPSSTDLIESKKFVPDFFNVTPSMPHGTIILSKDSAFGLCWLGKTLMPQRFDRIEITGAPLQLIDIVI